MKIFVYAPSYNETSGGAIVLHRLVHLINQLDGFTAYVVPPKLEKVRIESIDRYLGAFSKYISLKIDSLKYKTNPQWDTPIVRSLTKTERENSIVVYPEITFGNPLRAKNIVRWFLHQPGYFTGEIYFGTNELFYKFNEGIKEFKLFNSKLSNNELKVIYYPIDIYNKIDLPKIKKGTCHAIRKGAHKPEVHPADSILIDGLSHNEVADIFKKSERFICYDDYTAYSLFAVLCGCQSIVVPDENTAIEQWYPKESDRYGIAYGFSSEQLEWAQNTSHLVKDHILEEHKRSEDCVVSFLNEALGFFKLK